MNRRTAVIVAANVCALLALLYAAGVIPPVSGRTAEPMLLIAHRGDMARHPENTIDAFLAAAALDADGIEMDAWRSRSGTWWVMHDPTVDRTTDGTGLIAELSDAEMATLTIDGEYGDGGGGGGPGMRPPALTEALATLEGYEGLLYVHLKDTDPANARDLAMLLASTGRIGSLTVIAPSESTAAIIQGVDQRLRTVVLQDGLGVPDTTPYVDGWLTSAGRVIRPDIVTSRTYPVEVYAVADDGAWDEASALRRADRFNVRAFITNDLERAQLVLAGGGG